MRGCCSRSIHISLHRFGDMLISQYIECESPEVLSILDKCSRLSAAIDGKPGPPENMRKLAEVCTYFSKKHKLASVEFKKVVFNEFIKQKHPNGYLAKDAVVLKILSTGPIQRFASNEGGEPVLGESQIASLPSCEVTLLIPEANCLVILRTASYGTVIHGTTSGHDRELYDCHLSGMSGVWKFAVGSKCPVIVLPGKDAFRLEKPRIQKSADI